MPLPHHTQVFIIRIWQEPHTGPTARPEWRGVVEHVFSEKRHYFTELGEIVTLLAPYWGQPLGQPGIGGWLWQWLRHWGQRHNG